MERCLISGSHGFLGEHLIRVLERRSLEVIRLLRDWNQIPEVDYIFHLAAYGNLASQTDRATIFRVNIVRTFDLLEATRNMLYKNFVYVSTSAVDLPVQTLYSASKLAAEALTQAYDKPIVIARPYSITGMGEQKEHLIPQLIEAAYTGKSIPFVPEPVHDFIDVEDVVKGLIEISQKSPDVYFFGSGISYSNYQVLKLVEQITGRHIKTQIVPSLRDYDTYEWKAPYPYGTKLLEESIKEMVEAYDRKS